MSNPFSGRSSAQPMAGRSMLASGTMAPPSIGGAAGSVGAQGGAAGAGSLANRNLASLSSTPLASLRGSTGLTAPSSGLKVALPKVTPVSSSPCPSPRSSLTFTLRLVVHPKSFSPEDMILNPRSVTGLRVGDMVEIFQPELAVTGALQRGTSGTSGSKNALTLQNPLDTNHALFIKVQSLEPVKANFDISLSSALADMFGLQARKDVVVRSLSDESTVSLDFIEISFKNQYIGRSDNWRIKHVLQQASVFSGQALQVEGMKLRVDEILLSGRPAKSGLITSGTRFTFRSRSARLFFLIQLSEEMWEFADDGELYFEKVLGFLKILFTEWQKLKVTHALSIIFFSRSYLEVDEEWLQNKRKREAGGSHDTSTDEDEEEEDVTGDGSRSSPPASPPVQTDPNSGRLYQDHYMVVVDNEVHDSRTWEDLIKLLKKRFTNYHLQLKWGTTDPVTGLRGFPSTAAEGNFLEAINCTVSVYDKHYLDRDLYKTGQNIVLFSAGIGMFVVDSKLARLTKQRMVDGGIGCDLICMTRPPLHSVPLFAAKGKLAVTGPGVGFTTQATKLNRSQTGPASSVFTHQNAIRRGSTHLTSAFNSLQSSIQEGEEAEEKNESITHETHHVVIQPPTASSSPIIQLDINATPSSSPNNGQQTPPGRLKLPSQDGDSLGSTAPSSPFVLPPPTAELLSVRNEPSISPPSGSSANGLTPFGSSASSPSTTVPSGPMSSPEPPVTVRLTSLGSEKDLTKLDKGAEGPQPQYSVPHWLSIYFYDYQDLYDTPFGSLKTSHRDDTSRNRNEEFVSLSSCKLFDFFDLSFFNTGQTSKPSLIPYFPAKEIAPPLKASLFDAYDASVFAPATQPIGLISGQDSGSWRSATPQSTGPPATPTSGNNILKSPDSATATANTMHRSPQPPPPAAIKASPSQLQLPSSSVAVRAKTLGAKKKSSSSSDLPSSAGGESGALVTPQSTTSGPNVALQKHVLGAKAPTTAFQTRWGHLFGDLYATLDHLHNPLRPNWKSLCQPAVLPLTTDYWPAQVELRLNYFEYNHTLALLQNHNDYNNNTSALLEEVICQRQAQDYQHIVSDEIPLPKPGSTVLFFSLRNQVHQIIMDQRTNTIDVRRFVHKRVLQDASQLVKFPYAYFLWSPQASAFIAMQRDIEPNRDEFKWSDADNLLCDRFSSDLTEEMKYRRNHYAIIPAGIPSGKYASEYAMMPSSSKRFASQTEALRTRYQEEWSRESDKRITAFKGFFVFMFAEKGDKIVSAAATAAAALASAKPDTEPAVLKEKQDKAAAAQQALASAFASFGIEIDRARDQLPFPLPPVKSDAEREKDSADVEQYLDKYENGLGFAIADVPTREIRLPLAKLEGSTRSEWFQLQYDVVYNPHAVYHMEIKWLVATGMHLESWIKNFIKKAETRFGLGIVKIPTNQPLMSADSFHVPVPLPVHQPQVLRLLEEFLLRECGFVVDSELQGGCRQYVHESGMCAVRRLPGGIIWVNNHLPSSFQHRLTTVHLFTKIKRHAAHLVEMRRVVQTLVADVSALQLMKSSLF